MIDLQLLTSDPSHITRHLRRAAQSGPRKLVLGFCPWSGHFAFLSPSTVLSHSSQPHLAQNLTHSLCGTLPSSISIFQTKNRINRKDESSNVCTKPRTRTRVGEGRAYRPKMLIPYSTNLVIILVMMQASKKIPFEDENVLMGVRGLYILSNVIIFGVYMYVKMQIDKKRGKDDPK